MRPIWTKGPYASVKEPFIGAKQCIDVWRYFAQYISDLLVQEPKILIKKIKYPAASVKKPYISPKHKKCSG